MAGRAFIWALLLGCCAAQPSVLLFNASTSPTGVVVGAVRLAAPAANRAATSYVDICDSPSKPSWGHDAAQVACRSLGYDVGRPLLGATTPRSGVITNINCTGTEVSLSECRSTFTRQTIPCSSAMVACGSDTVAPPINSAHGRGLRAAFIGGIGAAGVVLLAGLSAGAWFGLKRCGGLRAARRGSCGARPIAGAAAAGGPTAATPPTIAAAPAASLQDDFSRGRSTTSRSVSRSTHESVASASAVSSAAPSKANSHLKSTPEAAVSSFSFTAAGSKVNKAKAPFALEALDLGLVQEMLTKSRTHSYDIHGAAAAAAAASGAGSPGSCAGGVAQRLRRPSITQPRTPPSLATVGVAAGLQASRQRPGGDAGAHPPCPLSGAAAACGGGGCSGCAGNGGGGQSPARSPRQAAPPGSHTLKTPHSFTAPARPLPGHPPGVVASTTTAPAANSAAPAAAPQQLTSTPPAIVAAHAASGPAAGPGAAPHPT